MTLAQMKITNGEVGTLVLIAEFLAWAKAESLTFPNTQKELNAILARWLQHDRREQMRRISEMRVARGESPLPAWLTQAPKCKTCDGDGKIMAASGNPKRPLRALPCPQCKCDPRA